MKLDRDVLRVLSGMACDGRGPRAGTGARLRAAFWGVFVALAAGHALGNVAAPWVAPWAAP